jgi:DNA cross-link repair 1A protein
LPQSQVVSIGADLVFNELKKQPKALLVCGSYTIGKERVFIGDYFDLSTFFSCSLLVQFFLEAIAERLNVKICVTRDKMNILNCFNDEGLNKKLTLNPNETNLHVLQMGQLNTKVIKF